LRREEERLTAREAVVVDEDAGCVLLDAVVVDAVLSHKVLLRTKPNMHHIISIFYGACWVWCSTKVSSTKLGKRVGAYVRKFCGASTATCATEYEDFVAHVSVDVSPNFFLIKLIF
jgi:hypothetical protein